jgi:hypothetical protein
MIDEKVAADHHRLLGMLITSLEHRYPNLWQLMDKEELAARTLRPRKDAFALYEAHSSSLAMLRIVSPKWSLSRREILEAQPGDVYSYLKGDHAWRSDAAQAMGSWRKTKLVYHMPKAMIEALRVTALDEILPGSVLEQIPAWSFYVPLPANTDDPSQLRGLLFHTAVDQDTAPMDHRACDGGEWHELKVFQANFVFVTLIQNTQEGLSFKDLVHFPLWCTDLRDALKDYAMVGSDPALVLLALQLLLYLCSNSRDLRPVSERIEPIANCDVASLPIARDHIEDWTAGCSSGIALQALHSRSTGSNVASGVFGTPVFQRAHWHAHGSGTRAKARVRELRWMHPLLLMSALSEDCAVPRMLH